MRNQLNFTNLALLAVLSAMPGCKDGDGKARKAKAELEDADGKSLGTATFQNVEGGLEIHYKGKNLPPGPHGFHIHDSGKCDAPSFESAGGHFNPTTAPHGSASTSQPHHVGDLPNLEVPADGTVDVTYIIKGATLDESGQRSLLSEDGTALIVHAHADDHVTQPSGGSGARIGCGVIERE